MLDLDLSAAFDIVDLQSRQSFFCPTDVVSVRTSRSRRLETVLRPTKVLSRSRLGQLGQCLGLGVGTERLGLGTQRLGLDLGLGLEGLVHIPN
jgi:hypothetical protein